MNDENAFALQVGESLPVTGQVPEGTEPGTPATAGPVPEAKAQIDYVRPLQGSYKGRTFFFQDGSRVHLFDNGTLLVVPAQGFFEWEKEIECMKLEDAIEAWKQARNWQPLTQPTK